MQEIFLMTDVDGLGDEGDVVKVAEGYARNYLLPRKLAAQVTPGTRRRLEKIREERVKREAETLSDAQRQAEAIQKISVTIAVKVGDNGQMFGSVTSAEIAEGLKQQGYNLDRRKVLLKSALRETGVFEVPVKLHTQVQAHIKVWVVEEE